MKPQLYLPFDKKLIDNPFGPASGALLAYYRTLGTVGHPGTDFAAAYGTPIPNCAEGAFVAAILGQGMGPMVFHAVNTILELPDGTCYEIQYGHLSQINVKVGDRLKLGDIIGKVGNTGDVFQLANGKLTEVTAAQKAAGSTAGAHLHFQVRAIMKTLGAASLAKGNDVHRLNDGVSGLLTVNGYVYEVPTWGNGFNGCVDPVALSNGMIAGAPAPLPPAADQTLTAVHAAIGNYQSTPTQEGLKALILMLEEFLGIISPVSTAAPTTANSTPPKL